MSHKTRFLSFICVLVGSMAMFGCSDDESAKNAVPGIPKPTDPTQDICLINPSDPQCDFDCVANPDDPRCSSPLDCNKTPNDSRCTVDCDKNPNDPKCKVNCEANPNDPKCTVDCNANPNDPKCKVDCDANPDDPKCKVDCDANPGDPSCITDPLTDKSVDSDNDGIPDYLEGRNFSDDSLSMDSDYDGTPDYKDTDSDDNGILDSVECCNGDETCLNNKDEHGHFAKCIDTDGDKEANFRDEDNDNDGFDDVIEIYGFRNDKDEALAEDLISADCNGDKEMDAKGSLESPFDCDGDGIADYNDFDSDNDGILDYDESLHPTKDKYLSRYTKDSDGDGMSDGDEVEREENGYKVLVDIQGRALVDADGRPLYERMVEGADGEKTTEVVYYDENHVAVATTLPNGSGHYYNPLQYCADEGCEDQTCNCQTISVCYLSDDCDLDSLPDEKEVWCDPAALDAWCGTCADGDADCLEARTKCLGHWGSSLNRPDFDSDGYMDVSEYAAFEFAAANEITSVTVGGVDYPIQSLSDLICNPRVGVQDIIDFYFELPYEGEEKNDQLLFKPAVSKLDVVINVDTTSSMQKAIDSVKENIGKLISDIQDKVKDTGFAITNFDDFPISTYGSGGDLPFRMLGAVSTDPETVTKYTQRQDFKVRNGGDPPEAGAESLYQIATGEGVQWSTGSVSSRKNARDTWGGVDFRKETLPVVVHVTDAPSHDKQVAVLPKVDAKLLYTPASPQVDGVVNPHYSDVLIPKLKEKGIRVITLYVGSQDANMYDQMLTWARESDAIVPMCAFNTANEVATQCKLGAASATHSLAPVTIGEKENQCVLFYQGAQEETMEFVSQGVDAIVKYGTYDVSTKVRGEEATVLDADGNETTINTACFIKKVVAAQYIAPPQEPERSCNPTAVLTREEGMDYDNGFTNFAPGTSNAEKREGANLEFQVLAQNSCVPQTESVQVFKAYIDVVNPTTGLVFGTRQVSIIVPAIPPKVEDIIY